MDFYESLFKYDLEIQNKLNLRLNYFLQNIQNPTQPIEISKTAYNIHFLNNLNQILEEINQSNILKTKIFSQMKQKYSKKYLIFAKNISEIFERNEINTKKNNNFNQKFINTDFKSKIISDINKIICDVIKTNIKKNFIREINNNYNSLRERCCSEKDTLINIHLDDELIDNNERENITTYKYIPNSNFQNYHLKNKKDVLMNLKNNFAKNNYFTSKSPTPRNLINISGKNIKTKPQNTQINNHNNCFKNNSNKFNGNSLCLKDYNSNNNVVNNVFNNDIKNQHSIKFDEVNKGSMNKKNKFFDNSNIFTKKLDEILPEKKNIDGWKNKKIYEKGGQKIVIKNIKLNKKNNTNNILTNNEEKINYNFDKKIYNKKENVNNSINDYKKSNRKQCLSPDGIGRNKKIRLIKFKVENYNLNLEINNNIANNIAILNNKFDNREKSEKNKNANTLVENYGKNIINRDIINKKHYLIRNYNTIMNSNGTENFIKDSILKKSHSREINANKGENKNLDDKNDNLKLENNVKNTQNKMQNKKRLFNVKEKRILSSKIHIKRRKEENKFIFWN